MLYECLSRFGDFYELGLGVDFVEVCEELKFFEDKWVQYNPRKNIPREGLSITSLDGGLSGIPDLDSVREYNIKHNLELDETDFDKKTELWPLVEPALAPFEKYLGRTHFIRMGNGGHFPPHRDQYTREINSFRLFIPMRGCNPPNNYFILDNKILHFDHGRVYFLNTCKEHTTFTTGPESMFVVANVILSEDSVDAVLKNMFLS
jgi:hypothetical protein